MKTVFTFTLLLIISTLSFSQDPKDYASIQAMCGCYAVDFRYAETFSEDSSYKKHENYLAKAKAEWIFVAEESKDRLVLQHLLIVRDSTVIKHWRQDWLYEHPLLLEYQPEKTWQKRQYSADEVAGTWSQFVYQVDDSPRYSGKATWVHRDARSYWESTSNAPLPRREFSKRSDYNLMQRKNRHEITASGWVHEQDNLKILQKDGVSKLIVEEKGRNTYTKIPDEACAAAQQWWEAHKAYWAIVRAEWENVIASGDRLQLLGEVNKKKLHEALFALGKEQHANTYADSELKLKIREILAAYSVESSSN